MSLPYFPMFPSDFEAKTSHLTLAEDGAYNRLLRICWMTAGCTIPVDEAWIMRRVRAHTESDMEAVRAILAEFFTVENGRYTNARLMRVWIDANDAHERRKNAGAKGGKSKSLKLNDLESSNAKAMLKQPEPEPEPNNLSSSKEMKDSDSGFDEFWSCVPRKVGKGAARKAWKSATKKADADEIISGMARYCREQEGNDPKFIAHPASWLNAERWADETGREGSGARHETEAERVRRIQNAWLSI